MSLVPERMLSHARWMDTSEAEQAVFTAILGPFRFKKYEILAARIEVAFPVKKRISAANLSVG